MTNDELQRFLDVIARMLSVQLDGHDRLLASLTEKREAIRTADLDSITRLCEEERRVTSRLSELEGNRLQVVDRLADELDVERSSLTVEALAGRADRACAERLRSTADRLRERMGAVRHESAVLDEAASALARHLAGLIQTVQRTVSHSGVYERRGSVAMAQSDFCVDVRS